MKRRILVLTLAAMLLVTTLATTIASPALAQPRGPWCDWYSAGFELGSRGNNYQEVWGYWCYYGRDYGDSQGWWLIGLWYEDYGWVSLF